MAKRNIALMVGPNSNKIISEHLSKLNDSIELTSYDTLLTLAKVSTMRRKFFERIVFSSKVLTDSPDRDLKELSTYLYENSSSTTLVFIVRGGQEKLVKKFNKIFKAPLYTIAVIDSPTTKDLMNVVTLTVDEIKERYSVKGSIKHEEEKGSDNPVIKSEESKPKKKGGFFSRLFGKKLKKNEEPKPDESPNNEIKDILSQTNESSLDISNLSLGAFADSHADTGYLGEDEIPEIEVGEDSNSNTKGNFGLGSPSFVDSAEMEEHVIRKPQETVAKTPIKVPEMMNNFSIEQGVGVLVDACQQREVLTGKWLVIGLGNQLDEISKNFDVVVDLDTAYKPMRKVVNLEMFNLAKEGMKNIFNGKQSLYSEGYSNKDLNFRGQDLCNLVNKSKSILVNASISDLDSIKSCLNLFDKIKLLDNGGLEIYMDLDNESKVLSSTLSVLKSLNPDVTTLNKGLLVSRRVW